MGSSQNLANKNMVGCQITHFDVRHHMYLHALLNNLPVRVFQVTSQNFNAMGWDDWIGFEFSTCGSNYCFFLKVAIKAFICPIHGLLLDGSK